MNKKHSKNVLTMVAILLILVILVILLDIGKMVGLFQNYVIDMLTSSCRFSVVYNHR